MLPPILSPLSICQSHLIFGRSAPRENFQSTVHSRINIPPNNTKSSLESVFRINSTAWNKSLFYYSVNIANSNTCGAPHPMVQIILSWIYLIYYSPNGSDISKLSGEYAMFSFRIIIKILSICLGKGSRHLNQNQPLIYYCLFTITLGLKSSQHLMDLLHVSGLRRKMRFFFPCSSDWTVSVLCMLTVNTLHIENHCCAWWLNFRNFLRVLRYSVSTP